MNTNDEYKESEFDGGRPDNWVDAHPELYPIAKDDGSEDNRLELAKEEADETQEDTTSMEEKMDKII